MRSNHVGISKSNTVPQLAEAVIIDRNSKENPQNEVNQNGLPELKKHFTSEEAFDKTEEVVNNMLTKLYDELCLLTCSNKI